MYVITLTVLSRRTSAILLLLDLSQPGERRLNALPDLWILLFELRLKHFKVRLNHV